MNTPCKILAMAWIALRPFSTNVHADNINWEEVLHFFNFNTIVEEEKRTHLETNIQLLVKEQLKLPSGQNLWKAFRFWEEQHPELGFQFEFRLIDESEAYIELKNYENQTFLFEIALNKVFAEDFEIPFWQVIKNNLHQKTNLGFKKLLNENMLYRPCLIKLVDPDNLSNWNYHLREQKLPFFITLAHEFLHALNQLERIDKVFRWLKVKNVQNLVNKLNNLTQEDTLFKVRYLFNKYKNEKKSLKTFWDFFQKLLINYKKDKKYVLELFETILPIQNFLTRKLRLQKGDKILQSQYKIFWQNGKNDDSLDEMTVILGNQREINPDKKVFIGETTFLQEYYKDDSIISWSHYSVHSIDFWQKMSIVLQKNYVEHMLNCHAFNLGRKNIQSFELDKDQIISEKYYLYEGNTTQREALHAYLQNEVNANGVAIKTILLLENKSVVCSGGKFIKKVEKEFWNFVICATKLSSIRLLPKYWKLKEQNNKTQNYYYHLNDKFNTLSKNEIIIIKL